MNKELTFEESLSGLLRCGNLDSFRLGFFRFCSLNTESFVSPKVSRKVSQRN